MTTIKTFLRSSVLVLGSLIVLILGLVFYNQKLQSTLSEELTNYLTEVAKQNVKIVNTQLVGDINSLKSAAVLLRSQNTYERHKMNALMTEEARANNFKRMGFALPNGMAFLSDGLLLDVSDKPYFKKAILGQPSVSDRFADAVDGEDIIVLAVPVMNEEHVQGVLFSTNTLDFYSKVLSVDSFEGTGYSLIIKANGDKVVASTDSGADPAITNIFHHPANATLDTDHSMRNDLAAGKSGLRLYERKGSGLMFLNYTPMGVNDWFLLSIVPAQHITAKTRQILILSLILCTTGVVIFSALLFYIMLTHKESREALYNVAYTDPVTGDGNWAKTQEDIRTLLHKHTHQRYAFVVFDVNKFKIINELLGYQKGNLLLTHIASVLRESLDDEEAYCRVTGDIFQALMHFEDESEIRKRLEMINEKIVNFQAADKTHYQVILSFGVYLIEDLTLTPTALLNRALIAHKTNKGQYQDIVAFYDEAARQQITLEKQIENDMEEALRKREFTFKLEPVLNLSNNRTTYARVRVYWNHPQKGLLDSSQFRPTFEKNGFISQLDRFIVEEVCKIYQKLLKNGELAPKLIITLSHRSLYVPMFGQGLQQLAHKYQINPRQMVLSLWEDTTHKADQVAKIGRELHQLGFKLMINQFTSANSSVLRLENTPIDLISVEGTFVQDISTQNRAQYILGALAQMAHAVGTHIIFEDIKTQEQINFLKKIHCELVSGPLISEPLTPQELVKRLEQEETPPAQNA